MDGRRIALVRVEKRPQEMLSDEASLAND